MKKSLLDQSAEILKSLSDGFNAFQDLLKQVESEPRDIDQWAEEYEVSNSDEEEDIIKQFNSDKFELSEDYLLSDYVDRPDDEEDCEPFDASDLEGVIDSPLLAKGFYMGIPVEVYMDKVERGPVDTLLDSSSGLYRERE